MLKSWTQLLMRGKLRIIRKPDASSINMCWVHEDGHSSTQVSKYRCAIHQKYDTVLRFPDQCMDRCLFRSGSLISCGCMSMFACLLAETVLIFMLQLNTRLQRWSSPSSVYWRAIFGIFWGKSEKGLRGFGDIARCRWHPDYLCQNERQFLLG